MEAIDVGIIMVSGIIIGWIVRECVDMLEEYRENKLEEGQ